MNVLILTGAGVSAESGVPTFRDANGLWEGHRVEDVATPQAFRRDPVTVHNFYNARRRALQSPSVQPNAAHHALVKLERWHREHDGEVFYWSPKTSTGCTVPQAASRCWRCTAN